MFDISSHKMLNVTTVLVGVVAGLLVYYVLKLIRYRLPPGPLAIPLIGHYKIYSAPDIHRKVYEISKKCGPVVQIKMGPTPWVFLNNIDTVKEALVKRNADFAGRPVIHSANVISEGGKDIVMADYSPTWKFHRKIASKALRHYLQSGLLENLIEDNLTKFMNKITEEKEPFRIKDYLDKIVFHQLFTLCFGGRRAVDDPEILALIKVLEEAMETIGLGLLEDFVPLLKDTFPTKKWKILNSLAREMQTFIRKQFNEHRETLDPSVNRDFTDSLLITKAEAAKEGDRESLDKLDETHLTQTLLDIFFAGVDTTRMTLNWFMLFISGLPEIQTKCQAEIDKNIGSRRPSMKDRGNLDYTEACLFETMRLGAIGATGVPHKTICDTKVGGYDIPKETTVVINHWALHHDPNYWTDAEKFDPCRYLDDNGKLDNNKFESWLPFSAGRRVCLGEAVARAELLLIVATLLQRFKISLPTGVQPNLKANNVATGVEIPYEYKVVVTERS